MYDKRGRLLSITDANNGTFSYAYNGIGQVTMATDPLGRQTSYSYDMHGWLIAETEAWNSPTARLTTMLYDKKGRLLSITRGQSPTLSYNDPETTSYGYDAMSHVTTIIEAFHTNDQRVTTISYDNAGKVTRITDPSLIVTTFGYDFANRVNRINESAN